MEIVTDLNKLSLISTGAYHPTEQELREMALALINLNLTRMGYYAPTMGISKLVYGH